MMGGSRLRIERNIGNNVVLARNPATGTEYILLGKGLGFEAKAGAALDADDPRIEKRYTLDQHANGYSAMFEAIDQTVANVSVAIIEQITRELGPSLNPQVYVTLPSHIQFAVYRLRNRMDILNPHLQETKLCFPREYEIAKKAARMIADTFGVRVPEDEIGFLTLHVQAAASSVPVGQLMKFSNLTSDLIDYLERRRGIRIDRDGPDYVRLVAHLRFSMERISRGKPEHNPFLDEIKTKYGDVYRLASEMASIIEERLKTTVKDDEAAYLAMHLYRLFQKYPQSPAT
ncbi:PRD domain-containing protein [Paenibacillus thermoaerophilus]|uniref:PRD domain-containing protein n=1 Tax=Paenibacillus thermoaerophilus TaxID=1215385 RepID=A0ABW2V2C2_9BACL|nr:PRD domain-containing protein [Paenibacillus thermoaerophilus]TMV19169.1 transcription antiterminator [Paenibacillus thermoaerophilus]